MTPQEAAEQHADRSVGNYRYCSDHRGLKWEIVKCHFLSGQQWQHAQDYQALSSALKEIAELHAWKKEMLQLWNKLDAYLQTRNDTRLGESKIDFVIKVMKEQEALQRVRDLLKNSDRLSPESHSEPDSANLPPESAS